MKVWNFDEEKKEIETVASKEKVFEMKSELIERKTEILRSLIGKNVGIVFIAYKNEKFGEIRWREKGILEKIEDGSIKIKYCNKISIDKIHSIKEF
jgi:hypothetical protein